MKLLFLRWVFFIFFSVSSQAFTQEAPLPFDEFHSSFNCLCMKKRRLTAEIETLERLLNRDQTLLAQLQLQKKKIDETNQKLVQCYDNIQIFKNIARILALKFNFKTSLEHLIQHEVLPLVDTALLPPPSPKIKDDSAGPNPSSPHRRTLNTQESKLLRLYLLKNHLRTTQTKHVDLAPQVESQSREQKKILDRFSPEKIDMCLSIHNQFLKNLGSLPTLPATDLHQQYTLVVTSFKFFASRYDHIFPKLGLEKHINDLFKINVYYTDDQLTWV